MVLLALKNLCQQLQTNKPLHIPSPPDQPRRASVVAIFRCRPAHEKQLSGMSAMPTTVEEFFNNPWISRDCEPELLFIQRATRQSDRWSGHVAFPGGKNEPGETDTETAERETLEEIGLDISSPSFIRIGQLDDREITSSATGKLMMILTPFGSFSSGMLKS
ncbi:hypothetical protein BX666DRAFT_1889341 [Dichotomocladium elegans]|nr:hypothetical protein BX666DRAFT_1889341 [Dichotomocladium elegans]